MRSVLVALMIGSSLCLCAQPKKYTIVFLHKNPDAEKISTEDSEKIMQGHMANINALAEEKKLLAAGPFEGGGGLFILNTTSEEEATRWLTGDPGILAKRWKVEMLPYIPRLGSVCPVSAPYEMVSYSLVRFDGIVSKYSASTYPQTIKRHDDYLKELSATGNVITEAVFGDYDGGIIVMKGEVAADIFANDPGVQEGLFDLSVKKLYIAKGSFCEQ